MACAEPVEVRKLVNALVPKVVECAEELCALNVARSFHGLQFLSSDHLEIVPLIAAVENKVRESSASVNAQRIATGLYGWHIFSSNRPEVLRLIAQGAGRQHRHGAVRTRGLETFSVSGI